MAKNTLETLMSTVRKDDESGCWIWLGSTNSNGYGQTSYEGKYSSTHRLFYILCREEIPEGLEIDHLCRNRLCCNPDHLEPVTRAENMRRARGFPRKKRKDAIKSFDEIMMEIL